MSPFGNGLLQSLRTGGIQEMDREGGQWSLTRPAAAATSVLDRLVLCTAMGAATEVATTRMALPLDSLPRVQRERPSGGVPLRSQLDCGQKCHP
jgi:hypothetical protein